ncbi:hypothetical protein GW17_00027425 [Ensete ventricosum]|nr:hypothetical protein GW17_00027425 [Ensete ventricosum]
MSTSLVWQPSRSTSPALAVAIASIGDTISLIVAYHRLTVRSLLLPSQQQLGCFSSSVQIPFCIVSTPPKKGPQHCGSEPSSLCTTTVASAPTSSGTFPTPSAISYFSLSNDSKSMTIVLLSLPFRSTDRSNRSSISSAEVNCCQTFTAVDNTTVSLISGQDLRPSQEFDLAGA